MRYQVREKILRLGEDNDILNEAGQPALQVDGKVLSLHGLMLVNDLAGTEVGRVSRKLVALMRDLRHHARRAESPPKSISASPGPSIPSGTLSVTGGAEMEIGRQLCGTRFHDHRERPDDRDDLQGVDQPGRLVWRRHRRGQNDLLLLCSVLALEAEQDRTQEHDRNEGPLGGLGGLGELGEIGGLGNILKGPL